MHTFPPTVMFRLPRILPSPNPGLPQKNPWISRSVHVPECPEPGAGWVAAPPVWIAIWTGEYPRRINKESNRLWDVQCGDRDSEASAFCNIYSSHPKSTGDTMFPQYGQRLKPKPAEPPHASYHTLSRIAVMRA